ncbi:MAG TPA: hypothetical protein VN238_14255 [Solirubrobacteraceae bacterium]|nr:hypothetical protein [Solirubrobacteraceae bacterium]
MRVRLREFAHSQFVFLAHVVSLILPGRQLPLFDADQLIPSDVSHWDTDELTILIEEGRRQSDRQHTDLQALRGRAQWLFTVAVTALAALCTGLVSTKPNGLPAVLWVAGVIALVYGIGGAASVMVARADLRSIHTAVLSSQRQPVNLALAQAYARMMSEGENTFATRLTVFRQSVVWCLCGGYGGLLAALMGT